jgi:hypothetical protein
MKDLKELSKMDSLDIFLLKEEIRIAPRVNTKVILEIY